MKRLLLTTGFLALLFPWAAAAQCPMGAASRLARMTPVGHYAKNVVDRADAGLSKARGEAADPGVIERSKFHFLSTLVSILYMSVKTDVHSVEYSTDLTRLSTCLHTDLAILEAKLEEVRCELNAAYDRRSPGAINMLNELAEFLSQSYRHLVLGATDTAYVDRSWPYYKLFDEPYEGWCCVLDQLQCEIRTSDDCTGFKDGRGGYDFFPTQDACLGQSICVFAETGTARPKYVEQCPFDSDYLGSAAGYGCDATVLARIESAGGGAGVAKEIEALQELAETRDTFLEEIDHIKETTETMDEASDYTMLNDEERSQLEKFGDTRTEEADHRRVYGCNADLTPEEREEVEAPESEETNMGSEGELTPEKHPSEEWTATPARGAFFFRKDHLAIWKAFFRLQFTWVREREFPVYLRFANEFPNEDDRKEAMRRDGGVFAGTRQPFRELWGVFMRKQATEEAGILPKAQDMTLQVRDVLLPLRPAMQKATDLVQAKDKGLRKFARNYAYFLRRSCIYRPCNERLETIMKILYTDDCFPYASGAFQMEEDAEVDKASWEKCKEAVEDL